MKTVRFQDAEQLIIETLDWDLSAVVSYDYIPFLLSNLLLPENDLIKLNLHVRTLLSLAICGKQEPLIR